mgnify:CR=1 FL=1
MDWKKADVWYFRQDGMRDHYLRYRKFKLMVFHVSWQTAVRQLIILWQKKNGLIVKADGKEMCSAIAKMANDEIVAKMSYNTFESFDEKSYSNDVYIKNLLQIYEKGV